MSDSKQKKIQHLFWRAGFGSDYQTITNLQSKSIEDIVDKLFLDSKNFSNLKTIPEEFFPDDDNRSNTKYKSVSKSDVRKMIVDLNLGWIKKISESNEPLRERMTLFWHGHFATRIKNPLLLQIQNNTFRIHALGSFRDLLIAVARDPAIMVFLGTRLSKKERPNENFARELMELFTIGRGNYTEQDIKEAARAFTGWGYSYKYEFRFIPKKNDDGMKTFMGKTGRFSGEDIIDIILKRPETAQFVVKKIYKYFVNEEVSNELIEPLASSFRNSNYDIEKLMRTIFTSTWFYDEKNVGNKIKSPTTLIIGLNRTFKVKYNDDRILVVLQRLLGQTLFMPPSVKGWDEGLAWIDTSSMFLRMKLASVILNSGAIDLETKDDSPEEFMKMSTFDDREKGSSFIRSKADWNYFSNQFPPNPSNEIISDFLIQSQMIPSTKALIKNSTSSLQNLAVQLCSLPEYQLY